MKLSIHSSIDLDGLGTDGAYITWLDVRAGDAHGDHAAARVALLHVGELADAHGDLWPILHRSPLAGLADVYFAHGWYKDDYADGAGIDLLYIESIEVDDLWQQRNLDFAIVGRLASTFGSGCQLVVMRFRNAHEASRWSRLGFSVSTEGRLSGFMHMKLAYRHAQVVDVLGSGNFEVLASDTPIPRAQPN
ncbi:MAG: hypothetical protein FWD73_08125 [Polyangiaceae bacterium]|nr:hypothetical protein [Polyangiaceae bacterium]